MDDPYLRACSPARAKGAGVNRPGVEYAGRWRGRHVELVYDPARHDVMFLSGRATPHLRSEFEAAGWRLKRGDGQRQFWVRDKIAVARDALNRAGHDSPPRGRSVA